jgi:hypothetical protein
VLPHILDQVLENFDATKNPGSPLCFKFPTNAGLKTVRNELFDVVEERLSKLQVLGRILRTYDSLSDGTPMEDLGLAALWSMDALSAEGYPSEISTLLVEFGFCDPVLLKKKSEGRKFWKDPRLVCMVSAIDTFIRRLLLGDALKEEQSRDDLPICTALDLTTPAQTEKWRARFAAFRAMKSSDVQGFEYAMHPYHQYCNLKRYSHVMDLDFSDVRDSVVIDLLTAITFCDVHRLLQTEEGRLFTSLPGEQSSGRLDTYSSNSFVRGFTSYEAYVVTYMVEILELGGTHICALSRNTPAYFQLVPSNVPQTYNAGDDNLDSVLTSTAETYLALNYIITDEKIQRGTYDFCSTIFAPSGCYQENIRKFVFHMVVAERDHVVDRYRAFLSCFRNHPLFEEAHAVIMHEYPELVAPSLVGGGEKQQDEEQDV